MAVRPTVRCHDCGTKVPKEPGRFAVLKASLLYALPSYEPKPKPCLITKNGDKAIIGLVPYCSECIP